LLTLRCIIVVSCSGKTYRTICTPTAKSTRTARGTFGTAVFGSPTDGTIDATAVSSFSIKVRRVYTQFTPDGTIHIVEFTGAAFGARRLTWITLTETNGALFTQRHSCDILV